MTSEEDSGKVFSRLEQIELRLAKIESGESNHLAVTIKSLTADLRNVATRIEVAVVDLDSRIREVVVPAVPQPTVEVAGEDTDGSRRGKVSYYKVLAENWLQIAVGLIIALVAIVITVYLFSRPR